MQVVPSTYDPTHDTKHKAVVHTLYRPSHRLPAEVVREKCEAALLALSQPLPTEPTACASPRCDRGGGGGGGGGGAAMIVASASSIGVAGSAEPVLCSPPQTDPISTPSIGGGGGGGEEGAADLHVLADTLQRRATQRQKREDEQRTRSAKK